LRFLGLASIGSVLTHLPKFFSWLPPNRQKLLVGETPNPRKKKKIKRSFTTNPETHENKSQ